MVKKVQEETVNFSYSLQMGRVAFVQLVHLNGGKKTGVLVTIQYPERNHVDSSLLPFTSGITPSERYSKTQPEEPRDWHEAPRGVSQ